jgi:hypothetical protein
MSTGQPPQGAGHRSPEEEAFWQKMTDDTHERREYEERLRQQQRGAAGSGNVVQGLKQFMKSVAPQRGGTSMALPAGRHPPGRRKGAFVEMSTSAHFNYNSLEDQEEDKVRLVDSKGAMTRRILIPFGCV